MDFLPISFSIFVSLVVLFIVIYVRGLSELPRMSKTTTHPTYVTSLEGIRHLLSPPLATEHDLLKSRAIPNKRLLNAFNLTNTLTSSLVSVHKQFTTTTYKILSATRWEDVDAAAVDAVTASLYSPAARRLPFDRFIAKVTLRVIVVSLYGVNSTDLDDADVDFVAYGINELWVRSKHNDTVPPMLLSEINRHLRRWMCHFEHDNLINFIIPAYEAMWQLVAATVALLYEEEGLRDIIRQNCRTHQFSRFPEKDGEASAEAIMQEVLRLYPPTRRIQRAVISPTRSFTPWVFFDMLRAPRMVTQFADIEAVQRDESIWGPTAREFDPMRHHPARCTLEQKEAFLAFGYGKLQCSGRRWAPRAAAIIAAAVFEHAGVDSDFKIVGDGRVGGRGGWGCWAIIRRDTETCEESMY